MSKFTEDAGCGGPVPTGKCRSGWHCIGCFDRIHKEMFLDERDKRVAETLRKQIDSKRDEAACLRYEAQRLSMEANMIESCAKEEMWYELHGYLSSEDIESLCDQSPVDLLREKK